jgi:hypothetical protein
MIFIKYIDQPNENKILNFFNQVEPWLLEYLFNDGETHCFKVLDLGLYISTFKGKHFAESLE